MRETGSLAQSLREIPCDDKAHGDAFQLSYLVEDTPAPKKRAGLNAVATATRARRRIARIIFILVICELRLSKHLKFC